MDRIGATSFTFYIHRTILNLFLLYFKYVVLELFWLRSNYWVEQLEVILFIPYWRMDQFGTNLDFDRIEMTSRKISFYFHNHLNATGVYLFYQKACFLYAVKMVFSIICIKRMGWMGYKRRYGKKKNNFNVNECTNKIYLPFLYSFPFLVWSRFVFSQDLRFKMNKDPHIIRNISGKMAMTPTWLQENTDIKNCCHKYSYS